MQKCHNNILGEVKEERPIIKRAISQFKEYNPIVDKKNIELFKINNPKFKKLVKK